jgi:hypothetical protein
MDELGNPPKVALVRWTTVFDNGSTMASCLQDAGFNAIGYGTTIEYPDGVAGPQLTALYRADYQCSAKYSLHPKFTQRWTADQWGVMFDYLTQALVPCLQQNFGLALSAAPTRDTFVAAGLAGNWEWQPYSEAETLTKQSEHARMAATCPENPPVDVMWG